MCDSGRGHVISAIYIMQLPLNLYRWSRQWKNVELISKLNQAMFWNPTSTQPMWMVMTDIKLQLVVSLWYDSDIQKNMYLLQFQGTYDKHSVEIKQQHKETLRHSDVCKLHGLMNSLIWHCVICGQVYRQ